MSENFYMKLTNIGLAKIANAEVTGIKVQITEAAVGDGNGAYYEPSQTQTALVNEVWRGSIETVELHPTNENQVVIEAAIPPEEGPFWIRELGLFDSEGDMVAVGKVPASEKPVYDQGSTKDLRLKAILSVENADVIQIIVDPALAWASRDYVDGLPRRDLKIFNVNDYEYNIANTLTAAGETYCYIYHPPYTYAPSANITYPANVVAVFAPGAILQPATAKIVTFTNDPIWQAPFIGSNVSPVFQNLLVFNPDMFIGAVKGGLVDSTAAFQKAIDTAILHENAGVYFTGHYLVGKLKLKAGLKMAGAGLQSQLIAKEGITFDEGESYAGLLYTTDNDTFDNGVLSDFYFNCSNLPVGFYGVFVESASNAIYHNLYGYNSEQTLLCLWHQTNCIIDKNIMDTTRGQTGGGIGVTASSENCIISNNYIKNTNDSSIMYVVDSTNGTIANNTIDGTGASIHKPPGIDVSGASNVTITGNAVQGCTSAYSLIDQGEYPSTNITVCGNTANNCTYGVHSTPALGDPATYRGGFNITGNTFYNVNNSIVLSSVQNSLIADNAIVGADKAIWIIDCINVNLANNVGRNIPPVTYVRADSTSGQNVLNVDDATVAVNGDYILIEPGTVREEGKVIQSRDTVNNTFTLTTNLTYTHQGSVHGEIRVLRGTGICLGYNGTSVSDLISLLGNNMSGYLYNYRKLGTVTNLKCNHNVNNTIANDHDAFSADYNGLTKLFMGTTNLWIYDGNIVYKDGTPSNGLDGYTILSNQHGTSANRPSTAQIGYLYFDTTIGKPIWMNSLGQWVDATGTQV
ncbi:MAG: phage tail protein [Candidatus Abawacabacteria bacterium]|nr:phage tail protein [Candidatus Abawacabacteria bacterium]